MQARLGLLAVTVVTLAAPIAGVHPIEIKAEHAAVARTVELQHDAKTPYVGEAIRELSPTGREIFVNYPA